MRSETIVKTYLKYNELNEQQKEKLFDKINFEWDLYDHAMQERVATLEALAKEIDARLDYSLSCVPDRGEFIKFYHDHDSIVAQIDHLNADDCPLTGVCYDADILHDVKNYGINEAIENYIKSIHDEYSCMLTDEYIAELCDANDYEFDSETLEII
jgi:hypothetical protein